jgi:hypothetical protein
MKTPNHNQSQNGDCSEDKNAKAKGNFVQRDKIVEGDIVYGDKVNGDKYEVSIHDSGDISIGEGAVIYVGGNLVQKEQLTLFDATAIRWLAIGTNSFLAWIRLILTASLIGILVAMLSYKTWGGSTSSPSASAAMIHGAIGALLGGLIAWYSPSVPAAMLRVAWIVGGLFTAELIYLGLFPGLPSSLPNWFGLPILHASMLVSLIAGPWLGLVTVCSVKVVRSGEKTLNRYWLPEALAIVGGCIAGGLVVLLLLGGILVDREPPIDPSKPPSYTSIERKYYHSGYIGKQNCTPGTDEEGDVVWTCTEVVQIPGRFDVHQDSFITLPGWLDIRQASAILIALGMIIPTSAALSKRGDKPRVSIARLMQVLIIGFIVSATIGIGLDIASNYVFPVQYELVEGQGFGTFANRDTLAGYFPILMVWGVIGMVSALSSNIIFQSLVSL